MTSIEILRRPSSRGSSYAGSLYARVIHRRKICCVTLKWKLFPCEWDKKQKKVIIGFDPVRNAYLKDAAIAIEKEKELLSRLVRRLSIRGSYSASDVIEIYRQHKKGIFLSVYIEKLATDLCACGRERTARAYRSVGRRISQYRRGSELALSEINTFFLSEWQKSILSEKRSLNTVSFYMRNLRSICNKAVREGLIEPLDDNLFESVFTGIRATPKRALTLEEMQIFNDFTLSLNRNDKYHIKNHTLQNHHKYKLQKDSDNQVDSFRKSALLFLFSFYARGMSFIDLAYLKKEDIYDGVMIYIRKKTGTVLSVKVSRQMQKIIDIFKNETQNSPFVFPVLSNPQKNLYKQYQSGLRLQNKKLKQLANACGIKKTLSTHMARHSWATIAKHQQIPLPVISEGLGHSSEKTTRIYLDSFGKDIIDRACDKVAGALVKKAV